MISKDGAALIGGEGLLRGGTGAMPCLKWSGLARIWSGRGRVGSVLGAVLVLRRKRFLVEMEGEDLPEPSYTIEEAMGRNGMAAMGGQRRYRYLRMLQSQLRSVHGHRSKHVSNGQPLSPVQKEVGGWAIIESGRGG